MPHFLQSVAMSMLLATSGAVLADARSDYEQWQAQRLARLTQPYGWLSLVGLHFLKPGTNTIGSAEGNTVQLASGLAMVGSIDLKDGGYVLSAQPDAGVKVDGKNAGQVVLRDDREGPPSEIQFGAQKASIVIRGEPALRVRNPDAPTRLGFMGLDYFDFDPEWIIDAAFEAYDPPRVIEISTVIGTVEKNDNPGRIVFSYQGKPYSLEAIREAGSDELFFIVADQTNAKDTYGAGRFLYAPLPVAGRVKVDFNRLYNPPCAFTSFSTCPLPPEGNRLRLRLEAGEKRYVGHTD
jgi:uncharacterized protein